MRSRDGAKRGGFLSGYVVRLFEMTAPGERPTRTALFGFGALLVLWAWRLHATWATWGDMSVDGGRELYMAAMIAAGKTLYRDVWYPSGPGAPYLNGFLFRLFGVRVAVLYLAGAVSALASAVFLYASGLELSSPLAGATAAAAVVMQAFVPGLFCFPLPYTYAAVYGCAAACAFLWLALRATRSPRRAWVFGAGIAAAAALSMKLEYGTACYAALLLMIALRGLQRKSWDGVPRDFAVILPGLAACALVLRWMISLGGVEFLTQENIISWPTTFFMKTYGRRWLASTGFTFAPWALKDALLRTLFVAGLLAGLYALTRWKPRSLRDRLLQVLAALLPIAYFRIYLETDDRLINLLAAALPRDAVLYVGLAAVLAAWNWRSLSARRGAGVLLLLAFVGLLAFRSMFRTLPMGYPIYYDGPAILAYLVLIGALFRPPGDLRRPALAESLLCAFCAAGVGVCAFGLSAGGSPRVPFRTERGTIQLPASMAGNYAAAVSFMKEKAARDEGVYSVPEDAGLYFFSGTRCPTRVCAFPPGVLAPGRMTDELLRELDAAAPRYLLWSNLAFPEYGGPRFGVDFDRRLGTYLTSRYRRVGPLGPGDPAGPEWRVDVWERVP